MIFSPKPKIFSQIFSPLLTSASYFEDFEKDDKPHSWFISEVIYCKKEWFIKWLKSPVSQHLWTVNMWKGLQHCPDLHGSSFVKFFFSLWYNFSSKNFVVVVSEILRLFDKIWAPDNKYSPLVRASVQQYQWKCDYLQNPKYFLNVVPHFWNLHQL